MLVKIQMHLAACISFSLDVHGDILSDERSRVLLAVDYACAVPVHSWTVSPNILNGRVWQRRWIYH